MNVSEEDLPNKWVRKMPQPWAEDEHGNPIHNIPRTRWACSVCKIYLCKDCFRMEHLSSATTSQQIEAR